MKRHMIWNFTQVNSRLSALLIGFKWRPPLPYASRSNYCGVNLREESCPFRRFAKCEQPSASHELSVRSGAVSLPRSLALRLGGAAASRGGSSYLSSGW